MKRLFALLSLMFICQLTFGQTDDNVIDRVLKNGGNVCFYDEENQPSFPGGKAVLYQWFDENLQYPPEALKKGIQGTVVVSFTIEIDGAIKNVKVVRGKDPSLDKEALRLMSIMPKWNPGKQNGEPIAVAYTLPLIFRLPASEGGETILNEKVYSTDEVDVQPSFPDGEAAMYEWIAKNFRYPYSEVCVSGTILVQLVIEKNGTISDIQILRSFDPEFAKETIRVVSIMPQWEPGKLNGQAVRVAFKIPVKFRLE